MNIGQSEMGWDMGMKTKIVKFNSFFMTLR